MRHIKEKTLKTYIKDVEIALYTAQFGGGKPDGIDGEIAPAYSFFEVKECGFNEDGQLQTEYLYIATQFVSNPVLTAVTEKQYTIWKNQKVVALPALATLYEWGAGEELLEKSKTYFQKRPG